MTIRTQIRPHFRPGFEPLFGRMGAAPESASTLSQGLTNSLDYGKEVAVMDSTQGEPQGFRTPDRWNSIPIPERVAQRALTNVDVQADGCWISRYSVASHGYAQIGWSIRAEHKRAKIQMVLAHRAAWVAVNGQMPLGMTLDHTCKVRRCVNPAHLRMLPNYENARRIDGKDWPMGQCANGHDHSHLVPVKRKSKSGEPRWGRTCRLCMQMYRARYESKRKAN